MYHFVPRQTAELRLSENVLISSRVTQYLKSFQLEAVRFLYERLSKHQFSVLNDESGLGKCVSLVALLSGVGVGKKTLIVLQNDDHLLTGWQFHLRVLTDLPVCVIKDVNDSTESAHSVYLSKWSVLRSIGDLSKLNFDYVIVDNRGHTLKNNFCTSMLLKQYDCQVNIVISSVDITSDVKLLYNVLRLGGCLEYAYRHFRSFDRKFHLPDVSDVLSKRVDLEEYYRQRGSLGEYIKDYRLRRYCRQYEPYLPLVNSDRYKYSLSHWLSQNNSNSTLSGSTIESSSEARSTGGTDEIFECLMTMRRERDLAEREEPEKISPSEHSDEVAMEPLVLELSESEAEPGTLCKSSKLLSNYVVLLSSDDCELVTPPNKPARPLRAISSAPTLRNKRRLTRRLPSSSSESSDSKTEQPMPSKFTRKKLNVRLSRVMLPQASKFNKRTQETKQPDVPEVSPKQMTPNGQSGASSKTIKRLDKPTQQVTQAPPDQPEISIEQMTPNKQPVARSQMARSVDQSLERAPEPITPKRRLLAATPKTEPRGKRKVSHNSSPQMSPRQTRGMQRQTRSADSRRSKYMAPIIFIEFDKNKKNTPRRKGNIDTNHTPTTSRRKKKEQIEKVESADTPKKIAQKGSPGQPDARTTRNRPFLNKSLSPLSHVEDPAKNSNNSSLDEQATPKESNTEQSTKGAKGGPPKNQIASQSISKEKSSPKYTSVKADPSLELLSSGSILSDSSYMQCGQKLPENLSDMESLPLLSEFRIPSAPQAAPLLLPSTLSFFSESEVAFVPNSNQQADILVINSSHDEQSEQSPSKSQSRRTRALKRKRSTSVKDQTQPSTSNFGFLLGQQGTAVNKSPDIFSHCSDLSQLAMGQAERTASPFEGFKIFGSEVKQLQQQLGKTQSTTLIKKKRERSCLDLLEQMFEQPQTRTTNETNGTVLPNLPSPHRKLPQRRFTMMDEDFFEITNNGEFGSRLRLNSAGNVSPVQQQAQQLQQQRNKITNYLISSTITPEDGNQRAATSQALRKSPKSAKSTQSTKLTRWFGSTAMGGTSGGSQSAPSTPVMGSEEAASAREARSAAVVKRKRLYLYK